MATATMTVRVRGARRAITWVKVLRFLAPVLLPFFGPDRLMRWAESGAKRLLRVEVVR